MITIVMASVKLSLTRTLIVSHLGKNPKNGGTPPILRKFNRKDIFNRLFVVFRSWGMRKMLFAFRNIIRLAVINE